MDAGEAAKEEKKRYKQGSSSRRESGDGSREKRGTATDIIRVGARGTGQKSPEAPEGQQPTSQKRPRIDPREERSEMGSGRMQKREGGETQKYG